MLTVTLLIQHSDLRLHFVQNLLQQHTVCINQQALGLVCLEYLFRQFSCKAGWKFKFLNIQQRRHSFHFCCKGVE